MKPFKLLSLSKIAFNSSTIVGEYFEIYMSHIDNILSDLTWSSHHLLSMCLVSESKRKRRKSLEGRNPFTPLDGK